MTAVPSPVRMPDAYLDAAPFISELTQAHGGTLLLENIGRFPLLLLELLRQTLESHTVSLPYGEVPAHFLLIATMTPCPCGFFNDPIRVCRCSAEEIMEYRQRIQDVVNASFDISIEVSMIGERILDRRPGEGSADIRSRVEHARARQHDRYVERSHLWVNADLEAADDIYRWCVLSSPSEKLLADAIRHLNFAPPKILRLLCLARTIADLSASEIIEANHLAEAIHYRSRL
jgi:magnesium chelatase family protein